MTGAGPSAHCRAWWLGGTGGLALGLALAVGALSVQQAMGAAGETVTPVFSEALPNLPGNSLTAVVVDYAPGGASGSHRHAGSVFAYVLDGAIRSQLDDGSEMVYQAGESFFEKPGTHHAVSANASTTEPARLLAIIVAETGATPTVFDE
jgi:quercetin dioxygenase-like cupin family protein